MRSGAVAQLLRMPVATLRVWERRYALTQTEFSPGGHRLYSASDVQRLALVKQLTELGHSIALVAPLDEAELRRLAATHAQATPLTRSATRRAHAPERPWRLAVVGAALAARLDQAGWRKRFGAAITLLGPFADAAEAAAALSASDLDAALWHEPQLQADWLTSANAAAPHWANVPKAVLYGFAAATVCDDLAAAGVTLLREPQPDAVLAQWLRALRNATQDQATELGEPPNASNTPPPRRWSDAALQAFASLPSTVLCECPRHVAELLTQLAHFEAYSAACASRSAEDAELHRYLHEVAAISRVQFEAALERVALHEGLMLPEVRDAGAA